MSAPPFDDQLLLGYLLQALEPHEMCTVESRLDSDPDLARQLAVVRERFSSLLAVSSRVAPPVEPAGDLVDRTLREIERPQSTLRRRISLGKLFGLSSVVDRTPAGGVFRWNPLELSVLAVAVLVIGVICIGLVSDATRLQRQNVCSYHLATLGLAMHDYAFHRQDQSLPPIERDGLLSFAGAYSVRLADQMLLPSVNILWCPDDPRIATAQPFIPSKPSREYLAASPEQSRELLRRILGGSYAYNLGYIADKTYFTPRITGRSDYPILADAGRRLEQGWIWSAHGRQSGNVLFADGRVRLIGLRDSTEELAELFSNRLGSTAAGLDETDVVLGPSEASP